MEDPLPPDRVKFYGPADLGNFVVADEAVALIQAQAEMQAIESLNDALEIHNALEFERHGVLPGALDQPGREELALSVRALSGQIAAFFRA